MTKFLSIIILLALLIGAFFLFKNTKNSYELLPVNESEPMKKWDNQVEDYQNWYEFTPTTGDFKVLMPGLPQHATDKIVDSKTHEARKYDIYATTDDSGRAFTISSITFPAPITAQDEEAVLADVVKEMASRGKENKLTQMDSAKLRTNRAVNFTIENADVKVRGKAIVKGNVLYVLSMIDKKNDFHDKMLDFYLNSFDFQQLPIKKKGESIPSDHKNAAPNVSKPESKTPKHVGNLV